MFRCGLTSKPCRAGNATSGTPRHAHRAQCAQRPQSSEVELALLWRRRPGLVPQLPLLHEIHQGCLLPRHVLASCLPSASPSTGKYAISIYARTTRSTRCCSCVGFSKHRSCPAGCRSAISLSADCGVQSRRSARWRTAPSRCTARPSRPPCDRPAQPCACIARSPANSSPESASAARSACARKNSGDQAALNASCAPHNRSAAVRARERGARQTR